MRIKNLAPLAVVAALISTLTACGGADCVSLVGGQDATSYYVTVQ
jgi:hypothetical protein